MKLVLALILLMGPLHATYQTLENFDPLLHHADADALFIFDVDEVLTTPSDPCLASSSIYAHLSIFGRVIKSLNSTEQELFLMLMCIGSPRYLLDPSTPQIIRRLQSVSHVIALTDALTSVLPPVGNCALWRVDSLQKLGVDFSRSTPGEGNRFYDNFPPFWGAYPLMLDGILFTNAPSTDKGELLVAYLSCLQTLPRVIHFVDDRMKNLDCVCQALESNFPEIAFRGYHYTRARDRRPSSGECCLEEWTCLAGQARSIFLEYSHLNQCK